MALFGTTLITFDEMYAKPALSTEVQAMMLRFPTEGKFIVVYKDEDQDPVETGHWLGTHVKPHETDQFVWADGHLYEWDSDCGTWDATTLEEAATYLVETAIPTSVTFLTCGDTVKYRKKEVFEEVA